MTFGDAVDIAELEFQAKLENKAVEDMWKDDDPQWRWKGLSKRYEEWKDKQDITSGNKPIEKPIDAEEIIARLLERKCAEPNGQPTKGDTT